MKTALILTLSILFFGCTDNPVAHSSKWKKMKRGQRSHLSGKARSSLHSQIITKAQKNGELSLIGTISPQVDLSAVEVEWKIPEHIEVLSGSEKESVSIEPGEIQNREISIKKSTLKPGDRIFFFVYQMKNGERMGSSAQYHHLPPLEKNKKKIQLKQLSEEKKKRIFQ